MLLFPYNLWGESTILNKQLATAMLLIIFFTLNLFGANSNSLVSTSLKGNKLKLTFKQNIEHVKFFVLKNKKVIKYVYDIKGASLNSKKLSIKNYRHNGVNAFRMGQFSKTHMRVVVESKYIHYRTYSVHGKVLTINLPKGKKSSSRAFVAEGKRKRVTKYSPTIIVDAGHGGYDIGASYKGIIEKKITLRLAHKLKKLLTRRGYRIYMTRSGDQHRSLKERTDYANAKRANLFISLHTNAAPRRKSRSYVYKGLEIFYFKGKTRRARYRDRRVYLSPWKKKRSLKLAKLVKADMLKSVRRKYIILDKGVKKDNFWVLRGTKMPSILVEHGYITDRYEGKRLMTDYYQNLLVQGIVNGVDEYFGRL